MVQFVEWEGFSKRSFKVTGISEKERIRSLRVKKFGVWYTVHNAILLSEWNY